MLWRPSSIMKRPFSSSSSSERTEPSLELLRELLVLQLRPLSQLAPAIECCWISKRLSFRTGWL
jgi:hypothetical protein